MMDVVEIDECSAFKRRDNSYPKEFRPPIVDLLVREKTEEWVTEGCRDNRKR